MKHMLLKKHWPLGACADAAGAAELLQFCCSSVAAGDTKHRLLKKHLSARAQQLEPPLSMLPDIRQHTSAYVSIRQHSSAYVSIRSSSSHLSIYTYIYIYRESIYIYIYMYTLSLSLLYTIPKKIPRTVAGTLASVRANFIYTTRRDGGWKTGRSWTTKQ
jgi:hypothetical protein